MMPPSAVPAADPLVPRWTKVVAASRETADTVTLVLGAEPLGGSFEFAPGQFNMLYLPGIGEVPISISGDPGNTRELVHTVRAVGAVSSALSTLGPGDWVGVRGPFGTAWPIDSLPHHAGATSGRQVVIVAGGIGLAPLRPVVYHLLRHRTSFSSVYLLYGARTPGDRIFVPELAQWAWQDELECLMTVDRAGPDWTGPVGVVPALLAELPLDPDNCLALVCGPEVMMRFTVRELLNRGISARRIHLSLERNMKCAVGFCGHCQVGPFFVCKDGPVFCYDQVAEFFLRREL